MKLEEAMGEKKVRLKDSYEAKELLGVAGKECVIASLRVNWRKREVIIKTKIPTIICIKVISPIFSSYPPIILILLSHYIFK